MRMITKSVLIAPVLIAVMASSSAFAQSTSSSTVANKTPGDVPQKTENTSKEVKPNAATATPPDPSPEPDFWHQETMTGDWGGARSRWKEKGVELEFKYTVFFSKSHREVRTTEARSRTNSRQHGNST